MTFKGIKDAVYQTLGKKTGKRVIVIAACLVVLVAIGFFVPTVSDTYPGVTSEPPAAHAAALASPAPANILAPDRDMSFPGIIAVVTSSVDLNEEEFRSAEKLVERFGAANVIHRIWPDVPTPDRLMTLMSELASNPEVGAIIINQAIFGTNAAIDAARAARIDLIGYDNLFIVSATPAESPRDVYARVDLSLDINNSGIPKHFVAQAAIMGADAIVHYSFPRHMAMPQLAARRYGMAEASAAAGIRFEDLLSIDPMCSFNGHYVVEYIHQDVSRQVQRLNALGYENIVFFSTACVHQVPLIRQVLYYGAMFVQTCCPSPFHAFPQALGIARSAAAFEVFSTAEEIIEATSKVIAEHGMTGRVANWALPSSFSFTTVGFLYAVEWLNGRVSQDVGYVDPDVLLALFGQFVEETLGVREYPILQQLRIGTNVFTTMYVIIMPYIVY